MEVILLKNISTLGDKHDIIKVKPGYGRNFLIPKGIAVIANNTNKEKLDAIIAKEKAEEAQKVGVYQEIANSLVGKTLKIGVKAGTSGKIFGSITSVQIANALKEQLDIEMPRKKIVLNDDIKEIGTYTADLLLHPEVKSSVSFELVQE